MTHSAVTRVKFINIVEELDLPVPRAVAYQAWTQFEEFPTFMKKVENVEQPASRRPAAKKSASSESPPSREEVVQFRIVKPRDHS